MRISYNRIILWVIKMYERIKNEVLKYFPMQVRDCIINSADYRLKDVKEIRIRVNRPIVLKTFTDDIVVDNAKVDKETINKIFECICGNSIYAFTDEISNGFITIFGGHRVGISGKTLYKEGKIYNIKDISSLNFRVARQIIGAGDKIINLIKKNGNFENTLIISPPGVGKTTVLRDIVRRISNSGYEVSLIDERTEIAACFNGIPQNDVGQRTDIMDGVNKDDGIKMMVRSMRPDFVATDEIGTDEDADAIMYAINSGVKVIATAHGNSIRDLGRSQGLKKLIDQGLFKKVVIMNSKEVEVKDF